jgi:hypothetical protein
MKFLLVQEMSVPPHEYILVPFMMKCGDFDTTSDCVKSSRRSQPCMNTFLSDEKGAPASDGNVTLLYYRRVAPYKLPLMSILHE